MLSFVFYKTLIYTFIPVFLQKKLVTVAVLGEGNWSTDDSVWEGDTLCCMHFCTTLEESGKSTLRKY